MALPVVIAKNQTGSPILLTRLGLTCPASPGTITLTDDATFYEVSADEVLNAQVALGNIVINDGVSDLSTAAALGYLDATGNLNGPVTNLVVGSLLRLADTTGRYTNTTGIKYYDPSATDPMSPAPADGDLYYNTVLRMPMFYDASRSKWLSVGETVIAWSRSGNTAPGSYFKIDGDLTYSATNGFYADANGTIVSIAYTRDDVDSATFEIRGDGVLLTGAAITSTAVKGTDLSINADFTSGQVLSVYNAVSGNIVTNCAGRFRLRWRI